MSVLVTQRKLYAARSILRCCTRDGREIQIGYVQTDRKTVLHVIERIEQIGTQCELVSFPGHRERFREPEIYGLNSISIERITSQQDRVRSDIGDIQRPKR